MCYQHKILISLFWQHLNYNNIFILIPNTETRIFSWPAGFSKHCVKIRALAFKSIWATFRITDSTLSAMILHFYKSSPVSLMHFSGLKPKQADSMLDWTKTAEAKPWTLHLVTVPPLNTKLTYYQQWKTVPAWESGLWLPSLSSPKGFSYYVSKAVLLAFPTEGHIRHYLFQYTWNIFKHI